MKRFKTVAILMVFGLWLSMVLTAADTPVVTLKLVSFFGKATAGGQDVQTGDVVTAYDPDGVLCGKCVVQKPGYYGFLHVYADDPETGETDEGAMPGDPITIKINGQKAEVGGFKLPTWTENGARINIDISVANPVSSPADAVKVNVIDRCHLEIVFNQALDKEAAENVEKYDIIVEDKADTLQVESASLDSDGFRVHLKTMTMESDLKYRLTVSNVMNISGESLGDDLRTTFAGK